MSLVAGSLSGGSLVSGSPVSASLVAGRGLLFPSPSSSSTLTTGDSDNLGSLISQSLSDSSKERIASIANEVKSLTDVEKLLLYLQLPTATNGTDSQHKSRGGVGVGKKADVEMSQTYAWIQTHLEEDVTVSLPKQEVYEDYRSFCVGSKFEPMCVADFGKAMKHIFPGVKPRRLGQRGNSKYCYSGLKKRVHVETPELPPMDLRKGSNGVKKSSSEDDMWMRIVLTWAEKLTETRFSNISDLASFLVRTQRIDPDHLDASLLKNVSLTGKKNAPGSGSRCSSQEPSRKKRSASSSSCPKTTDLRDGFNASSVPDDKVSIPRLSNQQRQKTREFPPPLPPPYRTQGHFRSLDRQSESASTVQSMIRSESASMDQSMISDDHLNTSSKRRQSVSAPSTLVSSPQLDNRTQSGGSRKCYSIQSEGSRKCYSIQSGGSRKCYEGVTQTDNQDSSGMYHQMKEEDDSSMYCHSQSPSQSSQHLIPSLSEGTSFGEFLPEEPVNDGPGTLVHGDERSGTLVHGDDGPGTLVHGDVVHGDVVHGDVVHGDVVHGDVVHGDDGSADHQISQLRRLLEKNLPQKVGEIEPVFPLQGFSYLRDNLQRKSLTDTGLKSLTDTGLKSATDTGLVGLQRKSVTDIGLVGLQPEFHGNESCHPDTSMGGDKFDPSQLDDPQLDDPQLDDPQLDDPQLDDPQLDDPQLDEAVVSYFTRETQYPSVPVSPSRMSDFTFQPIQCMDVVNSIPFQNQKSSVVHLNMGSHLLNSEDSPPSYQYNQQSVAVGTSEPPSGGNSPFLSPSETPTPSMNRSRNDSGQSYMRQTPFTVCDSGASSVGSSSVGSTPFTVGDSGVPSVGSSSVGSTPFTVGDSGVSSVGSSPFISPQTTPIPHRVRTGSGHIQRACQNIRSRHSSGPGIHFLPNMSMDPVSHFHSRQSDCLPGTSVIFGEPSWDGQGVSNSIRGKMVSVGRHRHLSSPYTLNHHQYVEEMKNYFRSQSVPAAREGFSVLTSREGFSVPAAREGFSVLTSREGFSGLATREGFSVPAIREGFGDQQQQLQSVPENYSMAKMGDDGYGDQPVSIGPSSPNEETSGVMSRDVMSRDVMSRDVMVSGMGKAWNSQDIRRNITESLDITPESDELQTAIEDLRNFDNDYSDFEQLIALSEPVPISTDLV